MTTSDTIDLFDLRSLRVTRASYGAAIEISAEIDGAERTLVLPLARDAARAFGEQVLAAAGDAFARTFPAPAAPEAS